MFFRNRKSQDRPAAPTSQAVLFEAFPPEEAGMAMALFGVGVMVGPTIGPTLGGVMG